jgi:hypothetical protein
MCLLLAVYTSVNYVLLNLDIDSHQSSLGGDHKWAGCTKWMREDMNDTNINGPVLIPLHQIVLPGR